MKFTTLTILLLALAAPVFAADSTATRALGLDFGVLMSPNEKPTLAYTVMKDWSLKGLGGPVFEKIELSAVYSNRETTTGSEVFAMRGYTTHDVCFGPASQQWYLGAGAGVWYVVNTDGGDEAHLAAKFNAGFRYSNYLDAHLFAEAMHRGGMPELYFCGGGIVVGW